MGQRSGGPAIKSLRPAADTGATRLHDVGGLLAVTEHWTGPVSLPSADRDAETDWQEW
ncbi:MAG: hypothetical protein U0556_13730 [Dehalococcoidia bacterium]